MEIKMKIAMVISDLKIAGAQMMVVELLSELSKAGYKLMLIILHHPQNNILTDKIKQMDIQLKYIVIEKKRFVYRKIEMYKKLDKVLSNWQPDIIHVHLEYCYTWLYCLKNKKIIIETIHSQPYRIYKKLTFILYRLLRRKRLIHTVLPTKSNASEFQRLFDESEENIFIIPNPVKIEHYAFPERQYDTEKEVVFIFVARFHPIKNHHMLLNAFYELLNEVPNSRLVLVGTGELFRKEQQYAEELGIISKVDFLGEVADTSALLKQADVCVISSVSECSPLVLVEAMASGLPVIVTDVGGMRDIVNGNGIKVSSDNYLEFAEAMKRLALSPELRREYGQRSLELVGKYDLKKVTEAYMQLYKQFLDREGKH